MSSVKYISEIHHVTAITASASENVNFYENALGLRLVKQTVNFGGNENGLIQMARHVNGTSAIISPRGKTLEIRVHATYNQTIERFLDIFDRVNRDIPLGGLNWLIDHAETITPQNIERVKKLGGGIAVQHRMAYQGEYFIQRYGDAAADAEFKHLAPPELPVSPDWSPTGKYGGYYHAQHRMPHEDGVAAAAAATGLTGKKSLDRGDHHHITVFSDNNQRNLDCPCQMG